jgi:hypothetical protein
MKLYLISVSLVQCRQEILLDAVDAVELRHTESSSTVFLNLCETAAQ